MSHKSERMGGRLCPRTLPWISFFLSLRVILPLGPESFQNRARTGLQDSYLASHSLAFLSDDVPIRTWFPKENLFSFQTATTTMQA